MRPSVTHPCYSIQGGARTVQPHSTNNDIDKPGDRRLPPIPEAQLPRPVRAAFSNKVCVCGKVLSNQPNFHDDSLVKVATQGSIHESKHSGSSRQERRRRLENQAIIGYVYSSIGIEYTGLCWRAHALIYRIS
jgi:hypothetical protein